jgi:hypothetical protein
MRVDKRCCLCDRTLGGAIADQIEVKVRWLYRQETRWGLRPRAARPTKGPENVPADWGKILLQQADMFSGGGMPRRAWEVATDATAAAFWA